jgi:drug/metabolite transporter (DMT)-like permease
MTGGTGYALAALACYGLGDFIYKRATACGVTPHHFLMGQAWCFCPAVLLYAWATDSVTLRMAVLWSGLAGIVIFAGFYYFLRSLAAASVSVVAPIFRLNFIVTAALAIVVLGEPFRPLLMVALAPALAAIWLLLGADDKSGRRALGRGALSAILIATLSLGAANFFHTVGLRQGLSPETALAAQAVVFTAFATLFVHVVERKITPPAAIWRHTVPAAAVLMAAFLFMLHGLTRGPASVLVPIAQMGFVVTAVLGVAVLHEPVTGRKVAGLAVAIGALAVLAFA